MLEIWHILANKLVDKDDIKEELLEEITKEDMLALFLKMQTKKKEKEKEADDKRMRCEIIIAQIKRCVDDHAKFGYSYRSLGDDIKKVFNDLKISWT